jgi:Domain of unknown function (DUF4216)
MNNEVCVRGDCTDDTQYDYYGVLKEMIKLEYDRVENKIILFKYHWFDIKNGVKVDNQHGIIEVKYTFTLRGNKPFVLA